MVIQKKFVMLVTPYLFTKKKINILISSRKNLQLGFPSGHIVFLQFLEPVCMAFFFSLSWRFRICSVLNMN